MTAINQRIEMWVGDSLLISIPLIQLPENIPFDMTGVSADWWVTPSPRSSSSEALLRKQIGDGLQVVAGGLLIDIGASDTQNLEPGSYYHFLRVRWNTDEASMATVGSFVLHSAPDMSAPP